MTGTDRVLQLVYRAIDEINQDLPKGRLLEKSPDTVLFGKSGKLDSLAFVNFIVATEQLIDEELDVAVSLTDEKAMSQRNSPFQTVKTLTDYISHLLKEKENE